MKNGRLKIKLCIGIFLSFIVIFLIFYRDSIMRTDLKKEDVIVEVFTEKDTYMDGEWIFYSVIIENAASESVFYKVTACNVEIIGENGFHVKTDMEGLLGMLALRLYELKAGEKIKRIMDEYNNYDLLYAFGLEKRGLEVSGRCVKEKDLCIPLLYCGWTGLCLPVGEYVFTAEFLYYDSDDADEPHKAVGKKTITVMKAESDPVEESYIMDGQMIFYARSDKRVYREGERIRTWAKVDSIDGQWFCWYWPDQISVGINLINEDTGEKKEIYNTIFLPFPEGVEDKETFFWEPSVSDSRNRSISKFYKVGNYRLEYVLLYYSFEKGEDVRATIELPITIVPDESGIELHKRTVLSSNVFETIEE